MTRLLNR